MPIEDYFSQIKSIVDKYVAASFVASTKVTFDSRAGGQGFMYGVIQFTDKSEMHFREFLDGIDDAIEKVMYSYHYQDSSGELVLRYDNSAHRPALAFSEHKHDSSGVKLAAAPKLANVLAEIVELNRWL